MRRQFERGEKMMNDRSYPVSPRPEVLWFAATMEKKLEAHDRNSHWSGLTQTNLMGKLLTRVKKLKDAKTPAQTIRQATNVANFAMMIADNAASQQPGGEG